MGYINPLQNQIAGSVIIRFFYRVRVCVRVPFPTVKSKAYLEYSVSYVIAGLTGHIGLGN